MERFTNGWMNEAFEVDERTMHAKRMNMTNMHPHEHEPSRTSELVKPSNLKARNNMLRASSSEPRTIEDSVHFDMRRWSYDTLWRHPSLSIIVARHALQQQHECTIIVLSSHVESSHESCYPHLHYGLIVNQCDVTWKSKIPTCEHRVMSVKKSWKSNIHKGSRIATRVSFTLGYKYPPHLYIKVLFTSTPPT